MQKCEYCGFVTKYKSDTCPMCGATKYESMDSFVDYEHGHSINYRFKNIPKIKNKMSQIKNFFVFLELFFVVLSILLFNFLIIVSVRLSILELIDYTGYDVELIIYLAIICLALIVIIIYSFRCGYKNKEIKYNYMLFIAVCLSVISVYILNKRLNPNFDIYSGYRGAIGMIGVYMVLESLYRIVAYKLGIGMKNFFDSKKEDAKYNNLMKNGILFKNIPYDLVEVYSNKFKIKIKWKSKDGVNLELLSKQIVNRNDNDKEVDLLIDKNDFGNYYIDYEIT